MDQRGTTESWDKITVRIWERDKGVCQVCLEPLIWEHYNCGHIVDRVFGGSDLDDNLVVMCNLCNQIIKPLHKTRAEYDSWIFEVRMVGHPVLWAIYNALLLRGEVA